MHYETVADQLKRIANYENYINNKLSVLNKKLNKFNKNLNKNTKHKEYLNKLKNKYGDVKVFGTNKIIFNDKNIVYDKISILKSYDSHKFYFYSYDKELKLFILKEEPKSFIVENKYQILKSNTHNPKPSIEALDYVNIFPDNFPNKEKEIKKIEKIIINHLIKSKISLDINSFNYEKLQGYLIFS